MGFLESIKNITQRLSYKKPIELEGIKMVLGVLTVKEELLVNQESDAQDDLEGMVYVNELRKRVLSYSIKEIEEELIPDIVEYVDGDDTIKKKRNLYLYDFLSNIPTAGIDILFEAYTDLKDEVDDSIEGKIKVDWYITPEERERKRKEEFDKNLEDSKKKEEPEDPSGKIKFREIKDSGPEESTSKEES